MEDSRIKGRGDSTKVARSNIVAYPAVVNIALELGVVPSVEGFSAEFEAATATLAEHETFCERKVPVVTTGTTDPVEPQIAVAVWTRGANWNGGRCSENVWCTFL